MNRFKNKAELVNALRLKFYAQDWNALFMDDGNSLFKYKGIDNTLYYIFVTINFKSDFITLKAQFPHSFLEKDINNLLSLCNLINKSYIINNFFIDIEKKQIFVNSGIQSFQNEVIEKLIVQYLYSLVNQIEVLNKVLLFFFNNDSCESTLNVKMLKQIESEWEKERDIKKWSFKL